jgi:hypothetical protein
MTFQHRYSSTENPLDDFRIFLNAAPVVSRTHFAAAQSVLEPATRATTASWNEPPRPPTATAGRSANANQQSGDTKYVVVSFIFSYSFLET